MLRLWKLAWPMMILGSARVAMRTVDVLVVGFLGSWAAASVGLGDVWLRLVLFFGLGIGSGTVARVSQGLGSGNPRQADRAMTQSTLIALVAGVTASVVFWWYGPGLIRLLGAEPRLVRHGGLYLQIVGLSAAPRVFYLMTLRGMAGAEDTLSPMWIGSLTTVVNIILTVLLVFGYAGLPELGVQGAAVGTLIGNFLAGSICLVYLLRPGYPLGLTAGGWTDWREGLRIVRISVPRVLNGGMEAVSRVPLASILLWFGSPALAAFEIAWRVMMLAMMPNWGISAAAGTYSGRHLGAGEPEDAHRQGWLAVRLALLVCAPISLLLVLARHSVAYLFIREQPTLDLAAQFIMVYGLSLLLYCVALNLSGALEGAGHTLVPMLGTGVSLVVLLGGSATFCGPLGYGIEAVYVFLFVSYLIRALMNVGWFEWFSWREHPAVREAHSS